jgi:predicted dehydrogenase/threonine dehydrogenase-like Zn-dependent dehydrogenase
MQQVLQDSNNGTIQIVEVPSPACGSGSVLVHNRASLISAGTEAAMLAFGKQNLLQKARSRPDLVKQVVAKARAEGVRATLKTVKARLDVPVALGYSCAGTVLEVGRRVHGLQLGDRVACAGAGYASHAEVIAVPKNLVVRIPDGVSEEDAAFVTTGAIALQGVRVADVRVGERVVVIGLGLIGLLTVQLLKAAGCVVLGTDLSPARVALARELGADDARVLDSAAIVEAVDAFTHGRGADAVLITAATKSSGPVELAGELSRLKGRVVAVGDVGLNVPRRVYYDKELDLRLSRSYGPGRYDPSYEEKGIDYPYAYVPFTEQRNMETFLQLVAEGKVTPQRMTTHRFDISEADQAYSLIKGELKQPFLGVLFTYPAQPDLRRQVAVPASSPAAAPQPAASLKLGVIGAGSYARLMLLPKLKQMTDVERVSVCTSRGMSAMDAARRFGFAHATTDSDELLANPGVNVVVIATRHDTHAALAAQSLEAGKHVFVEKPLAASEEELRLVADAVKGSGRQLTVGFNRRFAPLVRTAKEKFSKRTQPLSMLYRVNAGMVPGEHWTQDQEEGGGRIVGEVCHFVDLLQHICGAPPVSVYAQAVSGNTGSTPREDILTVTLTFADGSLGTVHYFANGDKAIPKEYLEIFGGGQTFILEDFRSARHAIGGKVTTIRGKEQDKGQDALLKGFFDAVRSGGAAPIPLEELVLTTLTTFRILDSLREERAVPVEWRQSGGPARAAAESVPQNGRHAPEAVGGAAR